MPLTLSDLREQATSTVTSAAIGYDQKIRRLAGQAVASLPYPALSEACAEALADWVICDMFEGNAPYAPRYVLPDYAKALREGIRALELDPPQDLDEALSFLTIMYGHVPSVTTYPVYLGDLDALLEPYAEGIDDATLDKKLTLWWRQLDRLLPDAFVHANIGPHDSRVGRAILRVDRALRQVVPNLTLKVDPEITPDDLIRDGVETVFVTGKPHFVNHPMMVNDHGEGYGVVSCYNALKIGGGSHTLNRVNLKKVAERHLAASDGSVDSFLEATLPHYVELTSELIEARVRYLVEESRFYDNHWLATEGFISLDRFSAMFGVYGLAECVDLLREGAGLTGSYGLDAEANALGHRIVERMAHLVADRPQPYCEGGDGRAYLHSQSGIDLDEDVTAGTRIPIGKEPGMRDHIMCCAPHHQHFTSGVSDIFHTDETAQRNPQAMVDIIRGAFRVGMRDFTFNLDSNEFIRITGYLVRKSDLVGIDEHGARHSSDYLAAGAEANFHMTGRAVKRIGAHELSVGSRH